MSALQKKLLLLIALVLAAQTGANLVKYVLELHGGGRFGGDFISFWQAAHRARAGDIAAIYDPDAWRRLLAARGAREFTWFVYPPPALLGLWPLGSLSYGAAVLVWSLAPLPFYFALAWLLARRSGLGGEAERLAAYAVLGVLSLPFLSANLFSGQTGAFIAVLFLAAACFWPGRPILAGICIGLMAIKPQLGLVLPFALLAAGQWRAIAAAAVTVAGLAAASTLWLGGAIWADYLRMTGLFGQFIAAGYAGVRQIALGPYVSLQAAGAPSAIAVAAQAVVSLWVLALVVDVFRRRGATRGGGDDGRQDLRFGLLAAGTLLATPYSLTYDTPMLVLAVLPLLARAWRRGWDGLELAAVTALVVLPFVTPFLVKAHVPIGPCALLLSVGMLYRAYRREAQSA